MVEVLVVRFEQKMLVHAMAKLGQSAGRVHTYQSTQSFGNGKPDVIEERNAFGRRERTREKYVCGKANCYEQYDGKLQ